MAEQRPNADLDAAMGFTPQTNLPQTSAELGDAHQAAQKATQSSMAAAAVEITSAKIDIEKATVSVPPLPTAEKPPDLSGITSPRPPGQPPQTPSPGVQTEHRREPEQPQAQRQSSATFTSLLPQELKQLATDLNRVFRPFADSLKQTFDTFRQLSTKSQAPDVEKPKFGKQAEQLAESFGEAKQAQRGQAASAAEEIGGALKKASGAADAAGAAAGEEAAGGAAVGIAEIAGPIGIAVGAVALLGVATAKVTQEMERAAKAFLEANREFTHASAQMAGVFARSDLRRFEREREIGGGLTQSAEQLSQAYNALADNTKEIQVLFGSVKNNLGTWLADAANIIVKPINDLATIANRWLGEGVKPTDKGDSLAGWLVNTARDANAAKMRNDPRFKRPRLPR